MRFNKKIVLISLAALVFVFLGVIATVQASFSCLKQLKCASGMQFSIASAIFESLSSHKGDVFMCNTGYYTLFFPEEPKEMLEEKCKMIKKDGRDVSTSEYIDTKNGITFTYPSEWKQNGEGDQVYFTKDPEINVLQLDFLSDGKEISLQSFVESKIQEYGCEQDKILERSDRGILVAHYCSATTEDYSYYFITRSGKIASLTYYDNFEGEWSLENKIKTFKGIVASVEIKQTDRAVKNESLRDDMFKDEDLGISVDLPSEGFKVEKRGNVIKAINQHGETITRYDLYDGSIYSGIDQLIRENGGDPEKCEVVLEPGITNDESSPAADGQIAATVWISDRYLLEKSVIKKIDRSYIDRYHPKRYAGTFGPENPFKDLVSIKDAKKLCGPFVHTTESYGYFLYDPLNAPKRFYFSSGMPYLVRVLPDKK